LGGYLMSAAVDAVLHMLGLERCSNFELVR